MPSKILPQAEPVAATKSQIDCAVSLPYAATASPVDAADSEASGATPTRLEIAADRTADHQPIHSLGVMSAGTAHATFMQSAEARPRATPMAIPAEDLALFVARIRELLDATDESKRRQLENEVLWLAVTLQAAGMFAILSIAHPALAAMVRDHLAESAGSGSLSGPV